MLNFVQAYVITCYICILTLLPVFIATVIRIYKASKSTFAYVLLAFTGLDILHYLLIVIFIIKSAVKYR